MLNIKEIVRASKGRLINGYECKIPNDFKIDSRQLDIGDFFIPLIGENVDGHEFIVDSVKKGAMGFFISKGYTKFEYVVKKSMEINPNICIIEVDDVEKSFRNIALYNREKHIDIPIVAITGSVGKTSTREMVASVLSEKYNVLITEKNYNSVIGVPLMLLKMDNQDVCVLEAGINHVGEMDILSKLLKPDVCVITNIGNAHIGIIGSKENIFKEKLKITNDIKGLKKVVINGDDEYLSKVSSSEYDTIKYSLNDAIIKYSDENCIKFTTKIYGDNYDIVINEIGNHNVKNALSAIKVGEIFKVSSNSIISGIKKYKNFVGRLKKKIIKGNITIIDDTYNASIDSMKSGLMTVNELVYKRKIAVLGDMLELGEYSKKIHLEVGELFSNINFDILYTLGDEAKNIALSASKYMDKSRIECFKRKEDLLIKLKSEIRDGDVIYFKASRDMKFNEIIKKLENDKI